MKKISIVTPCYNEEENIAEVYQQVRDILAKLPHYQYEHIFIDNASTDSSVSILRSLAAQDDKVKVIVNARNFGFMRSSYYGLLQGSGDATIMLVADLQDPPELILDFVREWENGFKIVVGVKPTTKERFPMSFIRKAYYNFLTRISETRLIRNFTGFGLYDRRIIEELKKINDPNPYFRGLICDIGFAIKEIPYHQPLRVRGITKMNFYILYDIAMLGITSHSKVPIRLATIFGFFLSGLSFLAAIIYLILKLIWWDSFPLGVATLFVGMFFLASVQLFFIGMLGEYVVATHTQALNRPIVVEEERINFTE